MALPLLVAGHASAAPLHKLGTPTFSAQEFFSGRTRGEGILKIMLSRGREVRVDGTGHMAAGQLVLEQVVTEVGKAPKERQWRIREVSPGNYVGTLSDAVGAVTGDVAGDRLHLRFWMKGGLRADQLLDLSSDRQSAHNRMTVRKFGIVVATLDETIRKVAPSPD